MLNFISIIVGIAFKLTLILVAFATFGIIDIIDVIDTDIFSA